MAKFSRSSLTNYIVDNLDSADISSKVAAFLIDNGKTSDLDSILRDVTEAQAVKNGIVELTARSAFPLDAGTKESINDLVRAQYQGVKQIIIHEVIDKSAIGGVNLEFANANLDLTIRTKLNKLREAIA